MGRQWTESLGRVCNTTKQNICTGGYFPPSTNIVRPLPDYTESMYGIQEKTERVYNNNMGDNTLLDRHYYSYHIQPNW